MFQGCPTRWSGMEWEYYIQVLLSEEELKYPHSYRAYELTFVICWKNQTHSIFFPART